MTFGEQLIDIRKKKGLSQSDLGKLVGIDKRIISRYETNKTAPSIDVAKKLADALDISLDYLTGSNKSLFIDDPEMTNILRDYDTLNEDDKNTIKKVLKAFRFYSKIEETQQQLAS